MVDIYGKYLDKVEWMKSTDGFYNRLCMTHAFKWQGYHIWFSWK